jgi:hypothetical protein
MSEGQHGGSTGEQWTAAAPPGQSTSQGRHDPGMRSYEPLASPAGPPLQHRTPPVQGPTQTVLAPGPHGQVPPVVIPAPKSVGVAFVLTFFFGPFGMLYSTVSGGLIMLGVIAAVAVLTGIVVGLITLVTMGLGAVLAILAPLVGVALWVVCIIWGCMAASNHNARLHARYGHPGMQPATAPGYGPPGR